MLLGNDDDVDEGMTTALESFEVDLEVKASLQAPLRLKSWTVLMLEVALLPEVRLGPEVTLMAS